MNHPVLYLTGPPATGKTTTATLLAEQYGFLRLSYGEILARQLSDVVADQEDLRARSAQVLSPTRLSDVDEAMIQAVAEARSRQRVVVDSHAVTKERYGFRALPYSVRQIQELDPTCVVVLFAESKVIRQRIVKDPAGRPTPSISEADLHTQAQTALALAYAHTLGVQLHLVDSDRDRERVAEDVAKIALL